MNDIKSFTLYREIYMLIDTIKPITKRDEFLGMIIDFYFKDKKPKLKPNSYEETIWENIEKPINKYKSKCLNGSKGGRPKKTENKTKKKSEIESKTNNESKTTTDVIVSNYDNNYVVNVNVNNNLNIYEYIEANFGRTLSPIEYEEISTWEDNELTRYAIREAILNGVYSIKYIVAILQNWKHKNINTIAEAKKNSKQHKETIPEWFDKKIEDKKIDVKEKKELEELIKNYE